MNTAKEINDRIQENNARIKEHKAVIDEAAKVIYIDNIIAARKGNADAARKLDEARQVCAGAEYAINQIETANAVLRDNKRQAIAAAAAPAVLAVLRKYDGKPYGEKTKSKIAEEVRRLCGCRFYIRGVSTYAGGYLFPEDVPGVSPWEYSADDLTLYTVHDPAAKTSPVLLDENNKINAAGAELLKLGFCAEYVEDARARALEIETARAVLEDRRKEYSAAVEKYNSLLPSTIRRQEASSPRL